jgi:hypothetical protein
MDTNVTSYIAILISSASIVLGIINHKRIRSTCCGHRGEVSIDVENTTPPLKIPLTK